jgi:peroxiredoxin
MIPGDLHKLPAGLPVPVDDGAAAHLPGMRLPSIVLPATDGTRVNLAEFSGRTVVFAYPRTGQPGQPALVEDWDLIPGARGCTPQTCAFRDLNADFTALGCHVFGLSTQDTDYQREMVDRLHVPFPILSDNDLRLTRWMRLPTMEVAGQVLMRRLAWAADDGVIRQVFYPVFPPDRNAADVLEWLRADRARRG